MSLIQIQPEDFFYQWRDKTNQIATLLGDLANVNVSSEDRDTFVEALNKDISNLGILDDLTTTVKTSLVEAINELDSDISLIDLSAIGILDDLTTTVKTSLVAAVNELDEEHGALTSLETSYKSTFVGAINEVYSKLVVTSASFTIGTENDNVIRVTVQLKDPVDTNLALVGSVMAYLSDNSDGSTLAAAAPSGGWVIGTTGLLIPLVTNKAAHFVSSAIGIFDVDITESTGKTFHMVVVLPLGKIAVSAAITFAA